MAGMFYSLQEAAEKLNKTEEEIKEIIKDGKLREFRDGPNLLFKIDEVEALMADTSIMAAKAPSGPTEQEVSELDASEQDIGELEVSEEGISGEEISGKEAGEDEISLAPELSDDTMAAEELAGADTVAAGEGSGMLAEMESGLQKTEDVMGETKGTSDEASLEEIEEDVNLDTFGSGSGLLDLSLQADDTSLGGILDEIYAPEGENGAPEAAEVGSTMEVTAEAEQMLPELAAPHPAVEAAALVPGYIEPKPDTLSNAFGLMLILPLLAVAYTAIVVVAGFSDAMPTIQEKIQGIIWYVMGGVAVAAGLIVLIAFLLSGGTGKTTKKQKAKKKPKRAPKTKTA